MMPVAEVRVEVVVLTDELHPPILKGGEKKSVRGL